MRFLRLSYSQTRACSTPARSSTHPCRCPLAVVSLRERAARFPSAPCETLSTLETHVAYAFDFVDVVVLIVISITESRQGKADYLYNNSMTDRERDVMTGRTVCRRHRLVVICLELGFSLSPGEPAR